MNKLRYVLVGLALLLASAAAFRTSSIDPSMTPAQGWDPISGQCLIGEINGNICSLISGSIICKFSTSVNATTFEDDCRLPIRIYKRKTDE